MKAMLLAAGIGERMLPLTQTVPKPLIPVLGRPLAPQIIARLAAEGIEEAVVNVHHLPDELRHALGDGRLLGLNALDFSVESERLLGTGGGLKAAEAMLRGSGTILVRNADFLADISLASALRSHLRSGCLVTLVVVPHRPGYTPLTVGDDGRVVAFGSKKDKGGSGRYLFTGYHLIEEEVLDRIPSGRPSDIVREVYFDLVAGGQLNAYVHDGFWWEFGEPHEYLEGSIRLVSMDPEARARLGNFDPVRTFDTATVAVGPGADLHAEHIRLRGTLAIGLGVMVGEHAVLEDSVVMPESWVGPGSSLTRCIVGPGTEIPIDFEAANAVIVAAPEGDMAVPMGAERIADLLVRRFDGASAR
ncbi:MAG TPA: NDP-sugar synthase [Candidatus Polarisedimenticolaceae bacterium]|nr:NDP-sugar synthase [Candidatus Polarisedimenticolaceae bacterium]